MMKQKLTKVDIKIKNCLRLFLNTHSCENVDLPDMSGFLQFVLWCNITTVLRRDLPWNTFSQVWSSYLVLYKFMRHEEFSDNLQLGFLVE